MMTTRVLASLSVDDVKLEAGATAEISIQVETIAGAGEDGAGEYLLRVVGLPSCWYSLAAPRLQLTPGEGRESLLVLHPPRDDNRASPGEHQFAVELVGPRGDAMVVLPARVLLLPPGGATLRSRLLDYLPGIFRTDPFLARFLLIFESIVDPIDDTIGNLHHYFDPMLTPAEFLPWLAGWVGLELDPGMEESQQRRAIQRAVELARWKGTRRALREELRIRLGGRPLIVENFDGMRLGQDAALGVNCHLGIRRNQCAVVTLAMDDPAAVETRKVEAAVNELKPANVGHLIRIVPTPSSVHGGDNG